MWGRPSPRIMAPVLPPAVLTREHRAESGERSPGGRARAIQDARAHTPRVNRRIPDAAPRLGITYLGLSPSWLPRKRAGGRYRGTVQENTCGHVAPRGEIGKNRELTCDEWSVRDEKGRYLDPGKEETHLHCIVPSPSLQSRAPQAGTSSKRGVRDWHGNYSPPGLCSPPAFHLRRDFAPSVAVTRGSLGFRALVVTLRDAPLRREYWTALRLGNGIEAPVMSGRWGK